MIEKIFVKKPRVRSQILLWEGIIFTYVMRAKLTLILAGISIGINLWGQVVIWQENFDQYSDGTLTGQNNNQGNPDNDWTSSGCDSCIDTADWWEIRGKTMEARDVNQVVFLQTELIDISGYLNVQFSVDVAEAGDHEGLYFGLDACADQDKEDYVNVLYRIDGGSWQLVNNALDWCGLYASCGSHTLYGDDGINSGDCRDHDDDWGTAHVQVAGIEGNTLEIRIETINSATDEYIRIDNLLVQGELRLPVRLHSFDLSSTRHMVLVQWQTAWESNSDYFEIQRALFVSDQQWQVVGKVSAAGWNDGFARYRFQDNPPGSGTWYYRLKQVDFDGLYQYSGIQSIKVERQLLPYPNPAMDYLIIPIDQSLKPASHTLQLFDATGKNLPLNYSLKIDHIYLILNDINSGNYTLTLNDVSYLILVNK